MGSAADRRLIERLHPASTRLARGLLVGLLLGPSLVRGGGLVAQETATVLGRVVERESRSPVAGAFVVLMDPSGVRVSAVLSDETGRFVLRAPAPGTFRLRTERIGLESVFSEFFPVTPGQVVSREVVTAPAAVTLAGIQVTGEERCDLGSEGSATVHLWEEARKALEVAEWVDEVGYVYETRTFRRHLDARARRVLEEESERGTRMGQGAFRSLEAELLARDGFIQADGEARVYYAPDASVLLSDVFLSTHCFRAVRAEGRLGLAFEPAPGRQVPEIEGTLWFTPEGALDRVEYRYVELVRAGHGGFGGEIHLRRLQEGAWIVQRWRIRMPELEVVGSAPAGQDQERVVGVYEVGGEVLSARRAETIDAVFSARRGAIRGEAVLADTGEPLAGAEIYLSGTGYAGTTAADGSFLLEEVLPGLYELVLDHPRVEALGELSVTEATEVREDSVTVVRLEVPSREGLLVRRCESRALLELDEPDVRDPGPPSVVGGIVVGPEGEPVRNWPVRVRWTRIDLDVTGAMREQWRATVVRSGAGGGWVVCGLPSDVYITVETADRRLERAAIEEGEGRWGRRRGIGRLGAGDVVWVEARSGG